MQQQSKDQDQKQEVDQIKVQVVRLMQQLNDLKVSGKSHRSGRGAASACQIFNPEKEDGQFNISNNNNNFSVDDELDMQLQQAAAAAAANGGESLDDDNMHVDGQQPNDIFTELLAGETFSDFKDYLIEESLLIEAYPECSLERIKVERELQASYYVMKKFLFAGDKDKAATENKSDKNAAAVDLVDSFRAQEDSFKEFICPLCLKLIQKCVTTLCGHSYCESCLEDYLLFKEVSNGQNSHFSRMITFLMLTFMTCFRRALSAIFMEQKAL